jgi:hypothetical protein
VRKKVYFDVFDGAGWPPASELERYFLASPAECWRFKYPNDCWGLSAEGADGTEHLQQGRGRIDIHLTMVGNVDHGVLLQYRKWGGGRKDTYYSTGDLRRLRDFVRTKDGDLMPIGLFIPFAIAWKAVKEFIERDGALPASIAWIADRDVPEYAFPDPASYCR